MNLTTEYSLPFKNCDCARRCTAPAHFIFPNSRFCIDFYLPQGTPILAARSGTVIGTESRYNHGGLNEFFGPRCNWVDIRHSDGQISHYVHLAWRSIRVRSGQRVKRGQIIGLSGQTGYASYPHLHFGVYDSEDWCVRPVFDCELPAKVSYKNYKLDKDFFICK